MKKIIFPILASTLLIGELACLGSSARTAGAREEITDYFYDSEFVMEKGARLTTNQEISYHGFMHRSSYEGIKKNYQDIKFLTIVYPSYYNSEYGKVNEDNLFGSEAIYTLDEKDTDKILLTTVESTVNLTNHNIEIVGNYNVALYGTNDLEYTGVSLLSAKLYGANVYRFASNNENSLSLVSLAENSLSNPFLSQEVIDAANEIIESYKVASKECSYIVETYIDNAKVKTENFTAQYGDKIELDNLEKEGYAFLANKSITKGTVLANDRLVLKLYYLANPSYKISYYLMDADANYVLCKQITNLKSKYFDVITLTEEQKTLPTEIDLPVPGYKDDYIFSISDSMVSGVNDGNLELKVCYQVSSRIFSYMKRKNGVYQLTKQLDNSVPFGYLMCGIFAKTAVFSVKIPRALITLGGGNPTGGITFTNGAVLEKKEGLRNAGEWVAMDVGLHVKGLKTSNNIGGGVGRCAEINDAAQCKELYYDKTVNVATNPVYINDMDRELTVVLYNDAFYVYVDNQYITRFVADTVGSFFMPRDDDNVTPRFHVGDSYMFGVYMGQWASTSSTIVELKQLYEEDALNEIKTNTRYSNIKIDN